jgi:prepilin-type N-terminal cleavage/methylation domain-containing protein
MRNRKGLTILELLVVMMILATVVGVSFYQFGSDMRQGQRKMGQQDKQKAIRRFLMLFRQDMLSMDQLLDFQVQRVGDPTLDFRVIAVAFDHYIDEFGKESVGYQFDPGSRKLIRSVEGKVANTIENIVNFRLVPYGFDGNPILGSIAPGSLYYFEAVIVFSDDPKHETAASFNEIRLKIFPRLKSAWNKSSYAHFNLSGRF